MMPHHPTSLHKSDIEQRPKSEAEGQMTLPALLRQILAAKSKEKGHTLFHHFEDVFFQIPESLKPGRDLTIDNILQL